MALVLVILLLYHLLKITDTAGTIESKTGNTLCPWELKMSSNTQTREHRLFNRMFLVLLEQISYFNGRLQRSFMLKPRHERKGQ